MIKIKEKAYELVHRDNYDEYYFMDDFIIHAETPSKAKYKVLNKLNSEGWVRNDGDENTLFNVSVRRNKEHDILLFDGNEILRYDYERYKKIYDRDNEYLKMIEKNPNGYAHIIKRGNYYCDDYNGYTSFYHFGGVYKIKDAFRHVKGNDDYGLHMSVINDIDSHNKRIQDAITTLKGHLIEKDE